MMMWSRSGLISSESEEWSKNEKYCPLKAGSSKDQARLMEDDYPKGFLVFQIWTVGWEDMRTYVSVCICGNDDQAQPCFLRDQMTDDWVADLRLELVTKQWVVFLAALQLTHLIWLSGFTDFLCYHSRWWDTAIREIFKYDSVGRSNIKHTTVNVSILDDLCFFSVRT